MRIKETSPGSKQCDNNRIDFHGATVIDNKGRETPITESMVREACNQLISEWENATSQRRTLKAS